MLPNLLIARNLLAYHWVRILQRTRLNDPGLIIGGDHLRCTIRNPPGILKCFTSQKLTSWFTSDPSLKAVVALVKDAEVFWNVGANCGLFSLFALETNPTLSVVSIEASTEHYRDLCANWLLQPSVRWICLHTAVGDLPGQAMFTRGLGGFDHVLKPGSAVNQPAETRMMLTLDGIAELLGTASIDVLKIDVEGFEVKVLQGARTLLKERRVAALV